ncbi:C-type natriuretic peptide 2 [Misgurnus anguillicaudatus]|uniref:C-type natriuretic peptide 2 n=1 Tax=Misgurnus anguillicaudatus TaxID=75329 RepID=UPI0024359FAF|nr:C-type natriuretic peptide 2 [Misgurnus anguillicaudatus]
MAFSSPLNFSSSLHLALLLFLIITVVTQVEGRPSRQRSDAQVLQDLFGAKISSLVFAPLEVSEGSGNIAPPLLKNGAESPHTPSRAFLDYLRRQRKMRGRSRKGVARGCFGMKVDRIGVISGLGC